MKRIETTRRPNERQRLEEVGFAHSGSGWSEDRYYEFTRPEIVEIEQATQKIYDCLHTVIDKCARNDAIMERMGIPARFRKPITESWERRDPAVCLRFDLARNQNGEIKLIEINGDTPTTLIESALIQWFWLVDKFPDLAKKDEPGQFNSVYENVKAAWQRIANKVPKSQFMAFSALGVSPEEFATCEFHRDLATQCGITTEFVDLSPMRNQLYYNEPAQVFHSTSNKPIKYWYKLYPWEWLFLEPFAPQFANTPLRWALSSQCGRS